MKRHRFLVPSLTAALLVATAAADDVILIPGSELPSTGGRVRGKVERETPELVRVDGRDVPLDQVADVTYDSSPPSFAQARSQDSNNNFDRAIELYAQAADEARNPLLSQASRFRRAAVLARKAQGDPSTRDQAVDALQKITSEMASSRHYGPALELLANLRIDARDFEGADAALLELAKLSWAADKAAVLRAQVMVKRGQSDQALAELDTLVDRLPESSPARLRADLARAEAMAALDRFDEAETIVREIIDEADPEDSSTLAPAYNTLGDCLRAAGKPRDALFAYLNTDILYATQADEHARSLAGIAQLWRVLDRNDRASTVVERLREQYPNSRYLPAATEATP